MRRSARPLEQPSGLGELFREGLLMTGGAIARSPVAVGGTVTFIVAMGFVTANALWYQPHFHSSAFFETRSVIRLVPESEAARDPQPVAAPAQRVELPPIVQAPVPQPQPVEQPPSSQIAAPESRRGDATVESVQRRLSELNLYSGEIDGLTGPQTGRAIASYRRIVGLGEGEAIDDRLMAQLGLANGANGSEQGGDVTASIATPPVPRPRDSVIEAAPQAEPRATPQASSPVVPAPSSAALPDPRIVRIQAGLRAFGNDGIELDGVVGTRTRDAIKEFQALFGLPESGQPDEATYVKMREIGLTE